MKSGLQSFRRLSVLRALFIFLLWALNLIHDSTMDRSGFSDVHVNLDVPAWLYFILLLVVAAVFLNTVSSLLFGFRPALFHRLILNRKPAIYAAVLLEAGALPFFIYETVQRGKEVFFPQSIDPSVLMPVPLIGKSHATLLVEKLQAVNFCLLSICSFLFVFLFWKLLKEMEEDSGEPGALNTGNS
jgi:hypothetical protein